MQATLQEMKTKAAKAKAAFAAIRNLINAPEPIKFSVIPVEMIEAFLIFGKVFMFQLRASNTIHEMARFTDLQDPTTRTDSAKVNYLLNLAWYDLIGDYLSKS